MPMTRAGTDAEVRLLSVPDQEKATRLRFLGAASDESHREVRRVLREWGADSTLAGSCAEAGRGYDDVAG
jgi:hypothetical protein